MSNSTFKLIDIGSAHRPSRSRRQAWTLPGSTRIVFLYARSTSANQMTAIFRTLTREAGPHADEGHRLLSGCSYPLFPLSLTV